MIPANMRDSSCYVAIMFMLVAIRTNAANSTCAAAMMGPAESIGRTQRKSEHGQQQNRY